MGVYSERVLPRLNNALLASDEITDWRRRCVEGLHGVVVEPGFGSGLNVAVYPREVTKVYAVDPAAVGQKLAADRISASSVEISFVGLDGQGEVAEASRTDPAAGLRRLPPDQRRSESH